MKRHISSRQLWEHVAAFIGIDPALGVINRVEIILEAEKPAIIRIDAIATGDAPSFIPEQLSALDRGLPVVIRLYV